MAKKNTKIYTVYQATSLIKQVLENNLPKRITVTGEIGDLRKHSSGHYYFSLKDENAVLPSVMWRSSINKLKFEPEAGMAVLATGGIDVYPPQGRYQFIVNRMEPAGVGQLQVAFEQLVKKLELQGLFRDEHKKDLPVYPRRICIVTSQSGAAVHDIEESIWHRWPCVKLFLYPVPVQGDGAAQEIADAIKDINRRNEKLRMDLLIVGRGGGSLEDLWAFNEEVLARAIFDSAIPIVSAVGHEVDVTIADLVADVRASTPTKAGVVAVPDIEEVSYKLSQLAKSISDRTKWKLQIGQQHLDELSFTLSDSTKDMFASIKNRLSGIYENILKIEPHRLIGTQTVRVNQLANQAVTSMQAALNKKQLALTAAENRLTAMNPKGVLKRGYSITTDKDTGKVIRKTDDVQIGQDIITELAEDNKIQSVVVKKSH